MNRKMATIALLCPLAVASTMLTPLVIAQTDALRGTWSGSWHPEGGRAAATVRFFLDGDVVTGEMLNPAQLEFTSISFDEDTLRLVAEAESSDLGPVRLEARIEEETRLNGTLTRSDVTGDVRLTKWTFSP